jgi:hypothetical protein
MASGDLADDTTIWRYMSFEPLVSVLASGHKLWFSRPFAFDDQWEGLFPPSYLRNVRRYAQDQGLPIADIEADFERRRKRHRYGHFVNCWHISTRESDAMWRLYGLSPEGVAIQSTIGAVRYCLRTATDGRVRYYDPADDIRSKSIFGPRDLLFKRQAFSWEQEYRYWFDDEEVIAKIEQGQQVQESDLSRGKLIQITELDLLIMKLVAAPGATDAFIDAVRQACAGNKVKWLSSRIERSYSDRLWESFTKVFV